MYSLFGSKEGLVVDALAQSAFEFLADGVEKLIETADPVADLVPAVKGDEATVRYQTTLRPGDSLEDLSAQLMGDGRIGIKHVSWSPPKRA